MRVVTYKFSKKIIIIQYLHKIDVLTQETLVDESGSRRCGYR